MDDALPSLTSNPGSVGSRFISQEDIDSAKSRRDEQWRAAYARLGQEPPPQPTEDVYDGRSLAEKLAANKIARQEEWEEKTKLANQFRALEEDEVQFLDTIRAEEERKELKRKREDAEEVKGFKEAVTARSSLPEKPSAAPSTTARSKGKMTPPTAIEKPKPTNVKNSLKGVVVKKKTSKPANTASAKADSKDKSASKPKEATTSENLTDTAKKQRLSSSD